MLEVSSDVLRTPLLATLGAKAPSSATSPARGAVKVGSVLPSVKVPQRPTAPLAGEVAQLRRSLSGARRGVFGMPVHRGDV